MADHRTSINQAPGSGTVYPFRTPTLAPLISDIYLSYDDVDGRFALPFRVSYLRGFGTATSPGPPDYGITVLDANDEVVFDSLDAVDDRRTDWGSNRRVYQWTTDTAVLRLVYFFGDAADFDGEISPDPVDGELDPRTYVRASPSVRGLKVGAYTFTGDVDFEAGYNMLLTPEVPDRIDGGPFINRSLFSATPGAGLGRSPGCDDPALAIRTINGVGPDKHGNFRLEGDGCFRVQVPVFIEDNNGTRTAQPSAVGLTSEEAGAALKLGSDCYPCCDCSYYARTYMGLRRLWYDRWKPVAASLEETRDILNENKERWDAYRETAQSTPLRLLVLTQKKCKFFIGGSLCNVTACCAINAELRFTLTVLRGGVPIPWPGGSVLEASLDSPCSSGSYAPLQQGPVFRFIADSLDPSANMLAKMRVCIVDGQEGDVLKVSLWGGAESVGDGANVDGTLCSASLSASASDESQEVWEDNGVPVADGFATELVQNAALDPTEATYPCGDCG